MPVLDLPTPEGWKAELTQGQPWVRDPLCHFRQSGGKYTQYDVE